MSSTTLAEEMAEAEQKAMANATRAAQIKAVLARFPDAEERYAYQSGNLLAQTFFAPSAAAVTDRVGLMGDQGSAGLYFYVTLDTSAGPVRVYDPEPVPKDRSDEVLADLHIAGLVDVAKRYRVEATALAPKGVTLEQFQAYCRDLDRTTATMQSLAEAAKGDGVAPANGGGHVE